MNQHVSRRSILRETTAVATMGEPQKFQDPLIAIGRRIGANRVRYQEICDLQMAARKAGDHISTTYLEVEEKQLYDQELMLKDQLSCHPAASLEGVALQLAWALAVVDFIADAMPEEAETFQVKRDVRMAERLIYSALAFVDKSAGEKLSAIAGPNFSSPYRDPWVSVETRVAAVKGLS